MDNRAIGVFDSGLGGLTAVKELHKILPNENIVYLGDTGRVPYGSRSRETIIKYAQQDIDFLIKKDIKMILAACGTDFFQAAGSLCGHRASGSAGSLCNERTGQNRCSGYQRYFKEQRLWQSDEGHPQRYSRLRKSLPAACASGGKWHD